MLGATVPAGWPDDEEARSGLPWHLEAIEGNPDQRLWRIRFAIELASNAMIGAVNLKGTPSASGDVEIGWGIVPDARRRGFAVEASSAVIAWAFADGRVKRVSATIPEPNIASQRVAQRLGMVRTEEMRRGLPLWAVARSLHR